MPTKIKTAKIAKSPTAKKVVAKKTATKKPVAKSSKLKVVVYAPNQESFWTTDGRILNSLIALHDALATMDKKVYSYHVCPGRHDFADWVEAVLADPACAKSLRSCKTPERAKAAIAQHLKLYSL